MFAGDGLVVTPYPPMHDFHGLLGHLKVAPARSTPPSYPRQPRSSRRMEWSEFPLCRHTRLRIARRPRSSRSQQSAVGTAMKSFCRAAVVLHSITRRHALEERGEQLEMQ